MKSKHKESPLKVLLVGSGGREHAMAWKFSKSSLLKHLYVAPGNPGMAKIATLIDIKDSDVSALVDFAVQKEIDFVVVGPEDPLAGGLVDLLEEKNILAFGPSGAAAQLEADKTFAKKIMRDNAIPTANAHIFETFEDAQAYLATRDSAVVVKASGLAKGKGVFVCDDPAAAILAAEKIMVHKTFGDAGKTIIIEDKLLGQEVSILAFVDGKTIYVMETAQDHKPIGDHDTGANTGGMGAYSPAPIVTEKMIIQIEREILVPVVDAMARNGSPYRGVLYAGLMITPAGPRVLEFNVRFGDPETQPILMRLQSDLLEVLLALCRGKLDEVTLRWDLRPAVCVVMASGGYPGEYPTGVPITGIEQAQKLPDVQVFHAGTAIKDNQLVTNGGRVLGVTAIGKTIAQAQSLAYQATKLIHFENANYRTDIAQKAVL